MAISAPSRRSVLMQYHQGQSTLPRPATSFATIFGSLTSLTARSVSPVWRGMVSGTAAPSSCSSLAHWAVRSDRSKTADSHTASNLLPAKADPIPHQSRLTRQIGANADEPTQAVQPEQAFFSVTSAVAAR
jgi:hypothetical protein